MTDMTPEPRLTSLAHGGGCGCKIAPGLLGDLLGRLPIGPRPEALMVDASTRDDAAVWRLDAERALVATTDFFTPIVDDPRLFGAIAATNALSDIYAMGARPLFALAILGAPVGKLLPATIAAILQGGAEVAARAGAPVVGGHSIDAAEPIYGLAAIGLARPDRILTNAGAKPGDVLILGKPLGIGVYSAAYKRGLLDAAGVAAMAASATLLNTPGPDLAELGGVHALTDVTGFGLLGHAGEMAAASGVGIEIDADRVRVLPGVRDLLARGVRTGASGRIWDAVEAHVRSPRGLDPALRDLLTDPQTSGGLLVACAPWAVEAVLAIFAQHGHEGARAIGRCTAGTGEITLA